ncbi:Crinkler (CRN) family protein [Phytophthora cinnamomi]|uniref:Crinkler (CRN) family protein n=1 Tax=Phytophthora cinnamomi TaxID=4785 RepID=UPI00355A29C4|nr:Crinkler (CRN) family protein [Phytophthora cinnamomi]
MTTKEIKFAIDGKANVIEIDDEADRDQRFVELDFSFEADPDDDFLDGVGEGLQHAVGHGAGLDDSLAADESVADIDLSKTVNHLNDKIKEKKEYGVPASKLKLYLAREGDTWLNSRHDPFRALKKGDIPD